MWLFTFFVKKIPWKFVFYFLKLRLDVVCYVFCLCVWIRFVRLNFVLGVWFCFECGFSWIYVLFSVFFVRLCVGFRGFILCFWYSARDMISGREREKELLNHTFVGYWTVFKASLQLNNPSSWEPLSKVPFQLKKSIILFLLNPQCTVAYPSG